MQDQDIPWVAQIAICLIFIGNGSFWFFFVDRFCDWQIRLLQSPTYRKMVRGAGLLFIAFGIFFALASAFGLWKLS
jgi:hypothetical protein